MLYVEEPPPPPPIPDVAVDRLPVSFDIFLSHSGPNLIESLILIVINWICLYTLLFYNFYSDNVSWMLCNVIKNKGQNFITYSFRRFDAFFLRVWFVSHNQCMPICFLLVSGLVKLIMHIGKNLKTFKFVFIFFLSRCLECAYVFHKKTHTQIFINIKSLVTISQFFWFSVKSSPHQIDIRIFSQWFPRKKKQKSIWNLVFLKLCFAE